MQESAEFGLANAALLDKIDKLFASNVGDLVNLPQIVVVGDQSSGKSSVLEGLIGFPFPRDSGLCTRFATQISFRRNPRHKISASIKPAEGSPAERAATLQAWQKKDLHSLDALTFKEIMIEVTNLMGIGSTNGHSQKTFSEDVLRLEIAGPKQEHFSVIDVPGIFKRTTQGLTTKEDMAMVDSMVRSYMSNPRSVMLTVVPSNADIAMQEILERAEELDPKGYRTFGILTKPDLVDPGAESGIMDVVQGRKQQLQLGWHILRNPGQANLKDDFSSRQQREKEFFSTVLPWANLDPEVVGVDALRIRLQDILAGHIRREFPNVKLEITQRLNSSEKRLEQLGVKRETEYDQRQFLMDIALKFQRITEQAIRADYSHAGVFSSEKKLRLATEAVNRGQRFADDIEHFGHTFDFAEDNVDEISDGNFDLRLLEDFCLNNMDVDVRYEPDDPALQDLLHDNKTLAKPCHLDILSWLKTIHRDSRGFELGTFDAGLLLVTLKTQAEKWHDFALGYISDVIAFIHRFIVKVLHQVAPSDRVRNGIMGLLIESLEEKYRKAMDHTRFLLDVEINGTPATHNHYFNDVLQKCRQERHTSRVKNRSISDCKHGHVIRMSDLAATHPLNNADHTVIEVYDILTSYYKVARKRFVDSVRMQVADHHLVTGPQTPLTLFSATFVSAMSAEQLEEVAGEDARVRRQRSNLEKEIEKLRESKTILK